jgi:peptide deformylase
MVLQEAQAQLEHMAIREILLLGNPLLSQPCGPVQQPGLSAATAVGNDLRDTLMDFRAEHGWGRAIAAPQIGVLKRIVYLRVERPWLLINPAMAGMSKKMMVLWDDCMSFPDLLVRVKRHTGFTLTCLDEHWVEHSLAVEGVLAELLQHEIDHLGGVLAVSRAVDGASFALRSQRQLLAGAVSANG